MSAITDRIEKKARALGACPRLENGMTLSELADLLFTPQGREFCSAKDFPKVTDLEGIDPELLRSHGILTQGKEIVLYGSRPDICLIGVDGCTVRLAGLEALYHIIVLDGSDVTVEASGYAVASVDVSATSKVIVINKDKTASISCHREGK